MNVCKNCNVRTELFFCPNCGRIFTYPAFLGDYNDVRDSLKTYVKQMVDKAKNAKVKAEEMTDKAGLSQAVYRKYYQQMTYLQWLCNNRKSRNLFGNNGDDLLDEMREFSDKCMNNECQIAIVGTIKAGKSMFINALLDREIASTYPTPETASVTKFRSSPDTDYVKVAFYTADEWREVWDSVVKASETSARKDDKEGFMEEYNSLNADSIKDGCLGKEPMTFRPKDTEELKIIVDRYTSARYAEHYFAKEVEIGIAGLPLPTNVVFVDTPGLNDPVQFRSDITKAYLKSANVILLCVKASSAELRAQEIEEIGNLFAQMRYSKERIYVIATQIDMQPDYLNYWEKFTYPVFIKHLSRESIYGSAEEAKKHIFPVTAGYYNQIRRAIRDISVWKDKENKRHLDELVRRSIEIPSFEELVDQYGEEKAAKMYKSPQKAFYERSGELIDMTDIPQVRQHLTDGPVREAESIIMNDVKDLYRAIKVKIENVTSERLKLQANIISQSKAIDVQQRMQKLSAQVENSRAEYESTKTELHSLLEEMENTTKSIINQAKGK